MTDQHSTNSTLRERVVEHVFVGEALRALWRWKVVNVEVLRSEFDAHGYDLVMARRRIVRHIQFKTGTSKKPGDVSVAQALAGKPSGCVIWIRVTDGLDMGPYFWFGGTPGSPLPALDSYEVPLRATHNTNRYMTVRKPNFSATDTGSSVVIAPRSAAPSTRARCTRRQRAGARPRA